MIHIFYIGMSSKVTFEMLQALQVEQTVIKAAEHVSEKCKKLF